MAFFNLCKGQAKPCSCRDDRCVFRSVPCRVSCGRRVVHAGGRASHTGNDASLTGHSNSRTGDDAFLSVWCAFYSNPRTECFSDCYERSYRRTVCLIPCQNSSRLGQRVALVRGFSFAARHFWRVFAVGERVWWLARIWLIDEVQPLVPSAASELFLLEPRCGKFWLVRYGSKINQPGRVKPARDINGLRGKHL